jgi:hypothetical protein
MRDCCLATQFAPGGPFGTGHCHLKSVELLRSILILRSFGFYTGLNPREKEAVGFSRIDIGTGCFDDYEAGLASERTRPILDALL